MLERFQETIDYLSCKISRPEVEEPESFAERKRGSPQSVLLVLFNLD
jgi:hypothetical protein